MLEIKELFDHVEKLIKRSKYHILTNGFVYSYNDEHYQYADGLRNQSPYEIMADYLNNFSNLSIDGFNAWCKTQNVYVLHKEYDPYTDYEDMQWDEDGPIEDMNLHLVLFEHVYPGL